MNQRALWAQIKETRMKKIVLGGVAGVALTLAGMSFFNQTARASASDAYEMLGLFGDVFSIVQKQYVVPVDNKKLIEAALEGMLNSLDPHSSYLPADDFKELKESTEGSYGGLGIEIQGKDGAIKVITPMDDTPAFRAGILAGDYITAINGKSIIGLKLNDAIAQMKGAPGTPITVTIFREGKSDTFDVTLKREIISVKSVKYRVEGDYGYVRITRFNRNTGLDTKNAVQSLKDQFKKDKKTMKGLLLDLRNNPGGLLDQSVEVVDLFIDSGAIVSQRGRKANDIIRFQATKGDIIAGLPMVVLTNNGSASAAEIVAGALKDHKRASVVGLTTFGKGSVQKLIPLGENRGIKMTVARYFTPSGQSIQKTGIEPDLEVAQSREQAKFLAKSANQYSEAALTNALDSAEGVKRRDPHLVSEIPPAGFDTEKGDFTLQRGIDVLSFGGDVEKAKAKPRGIHLTEADLKEDDSKKFDKSGKPILDKAPSPESKTTPETKPIPSGPSIPVQAPKPTPINPTKP